MKLMTFFFGNVNVYLLAITKIYRVTLAKIKNYIP